MPHANYETMTKYCPRCETEKDLGEFEHSYRTRDGYCGYCRGCMVEVRKISRNKNPDKAKERSRKWRKANPLLAKGIVDKATEKWLETRPGYQQDKNRRYRARKHNAPGTFTAEEFEEVKKFQDYTCLRCGRREPEITLHADHRIPLSKGGGNTISNIDGLCKSCNSRKGNRIY